MPEELKPSRTALITCLMRGIHSKYDRSPLIDDAWADRLVLPEERREIATAALHAFDPVQREARKSQETDALHAAWRGTPVYGGVIIRTRFTEEKVQAAVERGVRQHVIIGAGFDSFAMRQLPFARDLQVFEVDHPASQALKRDRLLASGASLPPNLHFVQADLGQEALGTALARSSYRFDQPAIMSWLGVTVYLTREANFATFRSIAEFAAPESELVFTYIENAVLHSSSPRMQRARAVAAAIGEPWICGFDSVKLGSQLSAMGLDLAEDWDGADMQARYCQGRTDAFTPSRTGRIALARVMPR